MAPRAPLSRGSLAGLIDLVAAPGLCSFQFDDRLRDHILRPPKHNVNSLPLDQVQLFVSHLATVANTENMDLLAGNAEMGERVRPLRGIQ
jgi:hypothetical protein